MSKDGKRRLFAFLGTGKYESSEYSWKIADQCGKTPAVRYIQTALCDAHQNSDRPINEIVLFLTKSARATHLKGLKSELTARGIDIKIRTVSIPDGDDEEQLWDLFSILAKELTRRGSSAIAFDITHGFRALPWFAAAVLTFLSATGRLPEDTAVFYGLYRANTSSSIVDLTAALDVVTWGFGLTQFLNSGKWDPKLSKYLEDHTRLLNEKITSEGGRSRDFFNGLNSRLTGVSDALALVRVGELLLKPSPKGQGLLPSLLASLKKSEKDVREHIPPLAAVLEQVRQIFQPFEGSRALTELNGKPGLQQLDNLIQLYSKWERFPEATTVLREAFTTLFCNETCAANPAVGKSSTFSNDCRHLADSRCNKWLNQTHRGMFEFRNDINHAGFRASPLAPGDLKNSFKTAHKIYQREMKRFQALRQPLFLNISNHPLDSWCDKQKAAALHLAEKIVDVPFPSTEPTLSEKQVQDLATNLLAQLKKSKLLSQASHALVMGDFSLAFTLVALLKKEGVTCWVTTSKRDKEEGFHFVKLRKV